MASELTYKEYKIVEGKPRIDGLPQILTGVKTQTLIIILEDKAKNLEVQLSYSVIAGYEAIVRSVKVINNSSDTIKVTKCMSASVDFGNRDFDEIHLHGSMGTGEIYRTCAGNTWYKAIRKQKRRLRTPDEPICGLGTERFIRKLWERIWDKPHL